MEDALHLLHSTSRPRLCLPLLAPFPQVAFGPVPPPPVAPESLDNGLATGLAGAWQLIQPAPVAPVLPTGGLPRVQVEMRRGVESGKMDEKRGVMCNADQDRRVRIQGLEVVDTLLGGGRVDVGRSAMCGHLVEGCCSRGVARGQRMMVCEETAGAGRGKEGVEDARGDGIGKRDRRRRSKVAREMANIAAHEDEAAVGVRCGAGETAEVPNTVTWAVWEMCQMWYSVAHSTEDTPKR